MATITDSEPGVAALTTDQIVVELRERVAALYRLNAELAAQCDRLGKMVDAACYWYSGQPGWSERLAAAVSTYEQQMTQLAKERG